MPEDVEKARENWSHYVYARDHGHLDYVHKATLCENYFYGEHWEAKVKAKLEAQGKPVLTINKVFSSLITIMGEQLQNRAGVRFLPNDDLSDPETAEIIDKLYIHILNSNSMDQIEASLFDEGVITSRGFMDCRMSFENNLRGEVDLNILNGKNVIVDPDADEYDPDTWNEVFITKWMTPNEIALKYSKPDAKELENKTRSTFEYGIDSIDTLRNTFSGRYHRRPGVTSGYADNKLRRYIRVIERQYKEMVRKDHFVDMTTGDMRVIPDGWSPERVREVAAKYELGVFPKEVPVIKWLVTADDMVLHESVSPYKHFTVVPYFPVFHKGMTIGMVENLISPQQYLNKTTSQELHVVNTTANSGWQMEEDQLVNMDNNELEQRGAETGLVLVRKKGSMPLEKINPNQVPTGLDRIAYKADEFIKELSGVSDSARGFDRADVAAKAIQAKQAVGGITNAKMFSNLAYTRKLLARNILDLIQEFYTEERVVRITGQSETTRQSSEITMNSVQEDGSVLNDLTIGKYDITIIDAPARNKQEDTQFDEAVSMREMGIPIPDHIIVESSHLQNKKEIAEELKELQGGGDATESEQRMAELELQLKELEAAEKQVTIKQKAADAKYTEARAVKTVNESKQGGDEQAAEAQKLQLEAAMQAQDLQIQRDKIQGELQLQREKMQGELQLKREIARADNLIKRAAAAEDAKIKKESADAAASLAGSKAAEKPKESSTTAK